LTLPNELDLHGVKHADVSEKVRDFILLEQFNCPLIIICGNSPNMVDIAMNAINKIPCSKVKENTYTYPDGNSKFQYGIITILKV